MCLNYFALFLLTSGRHRKYFKNWLFFHFFVLHGMNILLQNLTYVIYTMLIEQEIFTSGDVNISGISFFKCYNRGISETVKSQDIERWLTFDIRSSEEVLPKNYFRFSISNEAMQFLITNHEWLFCILKPNSNSYSTRTCKNGRFFFVSIATRV